MAIDLRPGVTAFASLARGWQPGVGSSRWTHSTCLVATGGAPGELGLCLTFRSCCRPSGKIAATCGDHESPRTASNACRVKILPTGQATCGKTHTGGRRLPPGSFVRERVFVLVRRCAAAQESQRFYGSDLVTCPRRDQYAVPRPDLSFNPLDLHPTDSLQDEIELLAHLVVVAVGCGARGKGRFGEALLRHRRVGAVEDAADRRSILGGERRLFGQLSDGHANSIRGANRKPNVPSLIGETRDQGAMQHAFEGLGKRFAYRVNGAPAPGSRLRKSQYRSGRAPDDGSHATRIEETCGGPARRPRSPPCTEVRIASLLKPSCDVVSNPLPLSQEGLFPCPNRV